MGVSAGAGEAEGGEDGAARRAGVQWRFGPFGGWRAKRAPPALGAAVPRRLSAAKTHRGGALLQQLVEVGGADDQRRASCAWKAGNTHGRGAA